MSYIGNPLQSTSFQTDVFTGDASTTAFTLSRVPASVTSIVVFVDGVKQASIGGSGAYTIDGSTLNFTAAPPNNAVVEVIHLGVQSLVNVPADATVTANSLAVDAVSTAKIQNGAITTAKLATQSVTGDKIGLTAINANNIVDASITTAKLSTTGVVAGTYGSASNVSVITIGADGRITSASNVAVSGGGGGSISITNDVNTNSDTFFPLLSNNATSGTLSTSTLPIFSAVFLSGRHG